MGHGQGSPAQCWKPVPSCRAGGAGPLFIREWGVRIDVSPGSAPDKVDVVLEDSAPPRSG